MSTLTQTLKNEAGDIIIPRTKSNAVTDNNGVTVTTRLDNLDSEVSTIKEKIPTEASSSNKLVDTTTAENTYQKILTPGDGITIVNNTVSAPVLASATSTNGIGWTEDYTPITWDGNFGTRPTFAFSEGVHLVKMSDDSSLTAELLIGSTITFYRNEETQSFTVTSEHIENLVDFFGVEGLVITNEELEFQGVWIFKEEYVEEGQTVSTGLWFFKQVDLEREEPITLYTTGFSYGSSTTHKINSSYISSGSSTTGQALTSDGSGGTSWTTVNNFNQFVNRPKYAGATMDSDTNIPQVPSKTSELTNDGDGTHAFLTEHQSLAAYRTSADQDVIDNTLQPKTDILLSTVDKTVVGGMNEMNAKIPPQASAENQLADKEFTNSSIATNTAHYIYKTVGGEKVPFDSVAELEAYSGTVTQNDYAFVQGTDSEGNAYYDRYKADVVGTTHTWAKEYRLNNSSFTAQQWSAITSGITSGLVALIGTALQPSSLTPYRTASAQDTIDSGKVDKLTTTGEKVYSHNGSTQGEMSVVASQGIPVATSVSSTSDNNSVVTPKGVYDYVEKPYELIETITLTEETESITRTQEPNGTEYNFKNIWCYIYAPKCDYTRSASARINSNNVGFLSTVHDENSSRVSIFMSKIENGRIMFESISGQQGLIYGGSYYSRCSGNGYYSANSIQSITLSDALFPSGTQIQIYAVRRVSQ